MESLSPGLVKKMDTKKEGCRSLEAKPELKKAEAERGAGRQARHNRFTIADKDSCGASPGRPDPSGIDSIVQKNQKKMMNTPSTKVLSRSGCKKEWFKNMKKGQRIWR